MNPTQLRYFEVLYEKRSLGEAARAIPMSHQGLRKSISSLERELGTRLFAPGGSNRLLPTPSAEVLHSFVQRMRRQRAQLDAELARIQSARSLIRLASAQGVLGYLGFDFLHGFRAKHPEVAVTEQELPDELCDEALLRGRCDLGLTVAPQNAGLLSHPLRAVERQVWVRSDDPLAAKPLLAPEDLAGRSIAVMGHGYKAFRLLGDLLREHQVSARLESASEMMWMVRYIRTEGRVALMSSHVAETLPEVSEGISSVPLPGIPWAFGISWAAGRELTDDERLFVEYCRSYARERFTGVVQ